MMDSQDIYVLDITTGIPPPSAYLSRPAMNSLRRYSRMKISNSLPGHTVPSRFHVETAVLHRYCFSCLAHCTDDPITNRVVASENGCLAAVGIGLKAVCNLRYPVPYIGRNQYQKYR